MSVVIRETALALGAMGHRVDIYTAASADRREHTAALSENVRLIHLSHGLHGQIPKSELFHHLPGYYDKLNAFVKAEGAAYDLLHSHYWLSARLGGWAQKDWNAPHVVTFHTLGWLKNRFGPCRAEMDLRIDWERRIARTCHRLMVATEVEGASLIEQCGLDPARVAVVPFGVNAATFNIRNARDARDRAGLPMEASVILFVGRFVSLKGIERLMAAVSMLPPHKDVRLLLIGGDGAASASTLELKALSRRLGIAQKVIIPGRIEHADLVDYYNAADVVALPSYYESFGLVVLESLACGTPVAATPVGVVESVVRTGENGIVFRDPTAAGIARDLSQVLTWVVEGRMSPCDVRATVTDFNWPVVAGAVLNQYAGAVDPSLRDGATGTPEHHPKPGN
jgi:D-inositol-3-phosphate glycosyltransferase